MTYEDLARNYGPSPLLERVCLDLAGEVAGSPKHVAYVHAMAKALAEFQWLDLDGRASDDDHRYAHELSGQAGYFAAAAAVLHSKFHSPTPYVPQAVGELLWAAQLADYSDDTQAAPNPADAARKKAEASLTKILYDH